MMLNRSRGIYLAFRQLIASFVLTFAFCFGLGLLWKWWDISPGLSLTRHQVNDAMYTGISIAIGFALGDYMRQKWPKRSKSKE
jgi:uncharacterized membrane protein